MTIAAGELQKSRISDGGRCSFHFIVCSTILSQVLAAQHGVHFEWGGRHFCTKLFFKLTGWETLVYPRLSFWVYFVPPTGLLHSPLNIDQTLHPTSTPGCSPATDAAPRTCAARRCSGVFEIRRVDNFLWVTVLWLYIKSAWNIVLFLWHCLIAALVQFKFQRV